MPANKYALLRYRIIDRCIRNERRPFPSKEDIRLACEEALYGSDGERISISTIDKDLWAMRNEGELGFYAPIKFSKVDGGYYYEDPNYTIAELPLTDDDLDSIRAAAETLFQFRNIPLFSQFEHAIEKIMDRMRVSQVNESTSNAEVIQFERLSDYKGSEYLLPLYRCCQEKRRVSLTYKKFGQDDFSTYDFAPYIIKEYRNRWYVIGEDQVSQQFRTFSLDRIEGIKEGDRIKQTSAFNAEAFFKYAVGITVTNDEPEMVELEVSENLAPFILTQPIHSSQKVEPLQIGGISIQLNVIITIELITLIMGFGKDIKVINPLRLRDEVKRSLRDTLNQYEI